MLLGGGDINIFIKHGKIIRRTDKNKIIKYYKANQATSGAEIRFNGRAMGFGLFQEIWKREVHNEFNSFLAIVDIRGENREVFPKTVTSKTRPRSDDKKIEKLFDYIRGMVKPLSDDNTSDWNASELISKLASKIRDRLNNKSGKVEENYTAYSSIKPHIAIDVYEFDGNDVRIYKAQKGTARISDVYDLLMFWDGLVADGNKPYKGFLVTSQCSKGVAELLSIFNEVPDRSGENYNFDITTWRDQGVNHP